MANVLTVPNSGVISFDNRAFSDLSVPPLSASARISYGNAGDVNITSYTTAATALDRFSVDGTRGRLFSVTDSLTGTLFSVNNITGLPILEVKDENTVIAGKFNTNALVVSGSQVSVGNTPFNTSKLAVSGNVTVVGNISATGEGVFTTLTAFSALTVPSASAGTPAAGHIYRVTDTLRYRDSAAAERTLALTSDIPKNLWIPASTWIPRTTNGCGVDSRELSASNFDELLFDPGIPEFAQALVTMPNNWNYGTVVGRFYWTTTGATTGSVVWGMQGVALSDNTTLSAGFGTAQTTTDTILISNFMHATTATPSITLAGPPAVNTPIQYQIYRDATAIADTLGVDARLLGVEIIYN